MSRQAKEPAKICGETGHRPLRIVVFGPESTGKTTLTKRLAAKFGEPWSAEYVRQFWDEHAGEITAQDLGEIAKGQIRGEDDAESRAKRVVFHDTDLLTCVLWDDLLFPGACPAWVREEAQRRALRTDLFLLCHVDVPWSPDPQRSFPDPRDRVRMMEQWRAALEQLSVPVIHVTGRWEERFRLATEGVQETGRAR